MDMISGDPPSTLDVVVGHLEHDLKTSQVQRGQTFGVKKNSDISKFPPETNFQFRTVGCPRCVEAIYFDVRWQTETILDPTFVVKYLGKVI